MSELENNIQFWLENSELEDYQWELYYKAPSDTQPTQYTQSNGTNPRIRRTSLRQQNAYIGIIEQLPQYIATIAAESDSEVIKKKHKYYLNFNDGNLVEFMCVGIEESGYQGFLKKILLVKTDG